MVIRVLDQNYYVLQTVPSETGLLQYVCRDVMQDDGHIYRIVMIPLEETDPRLVRWLSIIYRNNMFRELVQYANEKDRLQVVIDCGSASAVPLEELLSRERLSLRERLNMGEKVLERLILSDVPVFFAMNALDPEHVRFTEAMECAFTFELEDLKKFDSADVEKEMHGLRSVLRKLFSEELNDHKIPELKQLLDRIVQMEFSEVMEVYLAYLPIVEKYAGQDEGKLENKSLPFRIWEFIKALWKGIRKMFFLLVILFALVYLILSIRNFMAPTEQRDVYKAIGDLEIISGTAAETEAQSE